jgi:hypothetical protein
VARGSNVNIRTEFVCPCGINHVVMYWYAGDVVGCTCGRDYLITEEGAVPRLPEKDLLGSNKARGGQAEAEAHFLKTMETEG